MENGTAITALKKHFHFLTPKFFLIEKSFLEFARVKKEIIYFNKVLGDWEYEYDIETEKEKDFQKLLLEIKNKFSDSIRDYEIITINKNYKLNYLPDLENS